MSTLRFLPRPTVGAFRNQQHSGSHARTLCVRSRCGLRLKTCRPGHHHGTQRTHRCCPPGWLIFSPPLLSPDAAAALAVCVASSNAAARGDAAQAALIVNCCGTGNNFLIFVTRAPFIVPSFG